MSETGKRSPQKIREEEFIRTTGMRGFDELIEAISQNDGENYNLAHLSSLTPALDPSVKLRAVLADRRVAKLHELLSKMPPEDASKTVREIYQSKLADYTPRWEKANQHENGIVSPYYQHGVESMLFLCFEFCDERTFDECCREWLEWFYAVPQPTDEFQRWAGPQPLMLINLYALAMIRRGESIDEVNHRISTLCDEVECGPLPELGTLKFHKWYSSYEGDDELLKTYPGFRTWGKSRKLWGTSLGSEEYRTLAIAKARAWIKPPGLIESWKREALESTIDWFKRISGEFDKKN